MTYDTDQPRGSIDFHTHFTPAELMPERSSGEFLTARTNGVPSYTFHPQLCDLERMLVEKRDGGVALSVVSSAVGYAAPLDVCKRLNDRLATVQAEHGDEVLCMAHVNPFHGAASVAELDRARGLGLRGLAVSSDIDEMPLDDSRIFDIYEALTARGDFLFVHPSVCPRGMSHLDRHDMARSIGREFGLVEAIVRLVDGGIFDRFSRLQVVVSHLGGGLAAFLARILAFQDRGFWGLEGDPRHGTRPERPFAEYLESNLLFDTAGSSGDVRSLDIATRWLPTSRIVFGTDYPQELRTGAAIRQFTADIQRVVGDDVSSAIHGRNALKLLQAAEGSPIVLSDFGVSI